MKATRPPYKASLVNLINLTNDSYAVILLFTEFMKTRAQFYTNETVCCKIVTYMRL